MENNEFSSFNFNTPDPEILKIFSSANDTHVVSKDSGHSMNNEKLVQSSKNSRRNTFYMPSSDRPVTSGFREKSSALPSPILPPSALQIQQKFQREKMKEKQQFQKDFFRLHENRNVSSRFQNTVR